MPTSNPDSSDDGSDASDAEDRALLARIVRADRFALEQLYRRHALWLTARLENRCGDPDLADIAVQDTFIAVWQSAKGYRGEGKVAAWLWGIAIRRLIDQLRRQKPTPMAIENLHHHQQSRTRPVSFEDDLTRRAAHSELGPAFASLNPDLRAVLVATAIDGLTTREAAHLLGVPQGTVKTRLMRARAQLQEALR